MGGHPSILLRWMLLLVLLLQMLLLKLLQLLLHKSEGLLHWVPLPVLTLLRWHGCVSWWGGRRPHASPLLLLLPLPMRGAVSRADAVAGAWREIMTASVSKLYSSL